MALADAVQGATRPSQQITWSRADGGPEDLTGATLSGTIRDRRTGSSRTIAGSLSVTDAISGVFTWSYDAADVVDAGLFDVQFSASFPATPTPAKSFVTTWIVQASL